MSGCMAGFTTPHRCGRPGRLYWGWCVHEHRLPEGWTEPLEVCDLHWASDYLCDPCRLSGHECTVTLVLAGLWQRVT